MSTILIIEDDPAILEGLIVSLEQEHYQVIHSGDGLKGYTMAIEQKPDFIILDLMLPSKNGREVCRDLRQQGINTPILMLTSNNTETDTVVGFELGADDYVTKPFSIRELIVRIKAILRRQADNCQDIPLTYTFGNVQVHLKTREVIAAGKPVKLSVKEYEILSFFIQHEGEVVTRGTLLNEVWGYENYPTTRTVDNYILSLRKKLEITPSEPRFLLTIHTAGYKFTNT